MIWLLLMQVLGASWYLFSIERQATFLLSLVGLTELEVCFIFAVLSQCPPSDLDDDNDHFDAVFQFE